MLYFRFLCKHVSRCSLWDVVQMNKRRAIRNLPENKVVSVCFLVWHTVEGDISSRQNRNGVTHLVESIYININVFFDQVRTHSRDKTAFMATLKICVSQWRISCQ